MKTKSYRVAAAVLPLLAFISCELVDDDIDRHVNDKDSTYIGLDEVAEILSSIPIESVHVKEVHTAATSSSANGYDEEYTMRNLFIMPGAGVGDTESKAGAVPARPLRALIEDHVRAMPVTKGSDFDPDAFLDALTESDMQIYWPFSEGWDGDDIPVITFDPEDGSKNNIGYRLVINDDGSRHVEEVVVDEEMAKEVPVWVVNRNSDAGYTSLEMLRREDPQWGEGGGAIIVKPKSGAHEDMTKAEKPLRTLILKDFTMHRNYDSWFAGASEFFVKIGYLEDFVASTEAELRLYNPLVTDFMIVVKRNQIDKPQPFNAILMSDWSDQMQSCAFMITEDDGGTRTSWSGKAKVFIEGKSYGVEVSFPMNVRDEIVWRGELASHWFDQHDNESWAFGDVSLTFEIL